MPDVADSIDITVDLNGQSADAVPYHGGDVPTNAQPARQETVPEPKEGEKEPSLRDLLSDAFKNQQPDAPKTGDDVPKQPDTGQSDAAAPELVKVGDRWHNKDGTFASQAQIDAFNAGTKPAEGVAPPKWASQLTPLELEQFTALPAETKAFLERTMDGVNQSAERFNEYGTIEQLIGPRREAWAQNGMPPAVAIQQLLALSDFAGQDPGQFVMWFAEQHRLDLDALLDARDAALADGGAVPPYVTGLQQEIQQLRNTIGAFTNVNVQQQQQANMATVNAFMEEKDAAGKALRPYFQDVIDGVIKHVQVIRQTQPHLPERDVLQAAYDFATYSDPTIRAKIQADQQQALKDAAAAEAAKARQAGVSINGGPAGDASQQPNNANRTLREELMHAYNQSTLQ